MKRDVKLSNEDICTLRICLYLKVPVDSLN